MNNFISELDGYEPCECVAGVLPTEVRKHSKDSFLKILHQNIRSVQKNFDNLIATLEDTKTDFDIIVLTESRVKHETNAFNLKGYKVIINTPTSNNVDGTVILVNEKILVKHYSLEFNSCNATIIDVAVAGNNFRILTIYLSPSNNPHLFLQELCELFDKSDTVQPDIIIGDMNIDILNQENNALKHNYLEILTDNEYTTCIRKYTRVTENSQSCIDHIFTKPMPYVQKSIIMHISVTDHYATILLIEDQKTTTRRKKQSIAPATKQSTHINYLTLNTLLTKEEWNQTLKSQDSNAAASTFINTIQNYITQATETNPSIPAKRKKLKPWITVGLVNSIRNREKLRTKLTKQPYNTALRNCQLLKTLINSTKNEYYKQKLINKDSRDTWKIINEITNSTRNKKEITEIMINNNIITVEENAKEIAQEFNNYYTSISEKLANNIRQTNTNPKQIIYDICPKELEFLEVTEEQIENKINELKNKKSAGTSQPLQ